jgi:hypothetical protein
MSEMEQTLDTHQAVRRVSREPREQTWYGDGEGADRNG